MKTKLLLPMMAIVFAIGLSFATENSSVDQANDYVNINGTWLAIPEQPCDEKGQENCTIKFESPDNPPHLVYDEMDFGSAKKSVTAESVIIPRP